VKQIVESAHLLIKNEKGQVLLVQRNDVPVWVIPGGKLNKREKPKNAAERELFEETGMSANANELVCILHTKNDTKKYLYTGKIKGGKIRKNDEARQIAWVFPHDLPSPMTLYHTRLIKRYASFKGKTENTVEEINIKKEIVNQAIMPSQFLLLLAHYIKNHLWGSKSFKIR